MPDHSRRQVKRHFYLLKELNSPKVAYFATAELAEDDFTPSPEGRGEVIPTISQNLSATERELVQELLSRHRRSQGQGMPKMQR